MEWVQFHQSPVSGRVLDEDADVLTRALAPRAEYAFLLLRVLAGLMFAFHGVQKLFDVLMPPGIEIAVGSQVWIGGVIELVCGVAIAAGLKTTWAAFLASGTMAVAYIQFHWKLDFGVGFLPSVNGGEPALLYALLFLYIACRGGGRYSLDRATRRA
jgi:putative oxidoreductase